MNKFPQKRKADGWKWQYKNSIVFYCLKITASSTRQDTPPLWTDLVKMSSRKLRHASSFSFERTDFKNVIFENIHWAHSEDAEVAEVKRPRNPK